MKTMIIYSSRKGSTEKCAEKLQNNLDGDVTLVNFKKKVPNLVGFDTIIIGASILGGHIFPKLKKYIQEHEAELIQKKLALFICSGEERDERVADIFQKNYPQGILKNASIATTFGGKLELAREGFIMRTILHFMGKKTDYDRIKQNRIEEFAGVVNKMLVEAQ